MGTLPFDEASPDPWRGPNAGKEWGLTTCGQVGGEATDACLDTAPVQYQAVLRGGVRPSTDPVGFRHRRVIQPTVELTMSRL